ncbi:MAG: hypothetical protein QXR60_03570 [Candidatus Nanoarchaeia archaeon]
MDYKQLLEVIKKLEFDKPQIIYSFDDGTQLFIVRPRQLGKSLKSKDKYDIKTNFQIFMNKGREKPFRPNHLRVLLDLYLKKVSEPLSAEIIFSVLEEIYKGKDPLDFKEELSPLKFRMSLDSPFINVCCAQLFMAEQDINYIHGKIKPPRAYIMGYIRLIKKGEENIDKVLWNSVRHPPRKEFINSR